MSTTDPVSREPFAFGVGGVPDAEDAAGLGLLGLNQVSEDTTLRSANGGKMGGKEHLDIPAFIIDCPLSHELIPLSIDDRR